PPPPSPAAAAVDRLSGSPETSCYSGNSSPVRSSVDGGRSRAGSELGPAPAALAFPPTPPASAAVAQQAARCHSRVRVFPGRLHRATPRAAPARGGPPPAA
ncbi:unnamed protein product, partial [Prorocentrum cordatum]